MLGLGLELRVTRSRDVPGADTGFELGTGLDGGQGQVTWGCTFHYRITGRRLSLR